MIKYFKDLLATLKRIEGHLERLALCVERNHDKRHGQASLSVKHRGEY